MIVAEAGSQARVVYHTGAEVALWSDGRQKSTGKPAADGKLR